MEIPRTANFTTLGSDRITDEVELADIRPLLFKMLSVLQADCLTTVKLLSIAKCFALVDLTDDVEQKDASGMHGSVPQQIASISR
jgi:hypothetical protein